MKLICFCIPRPLSRILLCLEIETKRSRKFNIRKWIEAMLSWKLHTIGIHGGNCT
ncbi:Hypothetical predicted protein [Olea europaea subsp. europaea]|uniref:Uncharacterized protein n=1 Tax=Olea europaea subsp. europaea TaxID=158383 RepID=A0A8S0PC82_OLEEU|nr:Hypothetical predicted protein [Olea europaea subsp. europaea]